LKKLMFVFNVGANHVYVQLKNILKETIDLMSVMNVKNGSIEMELIFVILFRKLNIFYLLFLYLIINKKLIIILII